MIKNKTLLLYVILSALIGSSITFFAFIKMAKNKEEKIREAEISGVKEGKDGSNCNYSINRLSGYKYTHPLFSTEPECQAAKYNSLQTTIAEFIENEKSNGLSEASVYLMDFSGNTWMDVNENEKYTPGSLFKVVTLVAYLRLAETKPGVLEEEIEFSNNNNERAHPQTFNSKTIKEGNRYKVKELLHYMIAYSDNNATMLLHKFVDVGMFQKIFSDIGLRVPDMHGQSYQMSVKEYSKFLRVLYDGGYLTITASDYALSLLAECDFKEGIVSELPPTVKVAHKFGQAGTPEFPELHESAIIYLDNRPYLLTIMTRGRDIKNQAKVIGHISRIVYDKMIGDPV